MINRSVFFSMRQERGSKDALRPCVVPPSYALQGTNRAQMHLINSGVLPLFCLSVCLDLSVYLVCLVCLVLCVYLSTRATIEVHRSFLGFLRPNTPRLRILPGSASYHLEVAVVSGQVLIVRVCGSLGPVWGPVEIICRLCL